jgi:hypothetical protein
MKIFPISSVAEQISCKDQVAGSIPCIGNQINRNDPLMGLEPLAQRRRAEGRALG